MIESVMSREKLYFYIITIIWTYIIAIAGPIILLGEVNPDGSGKRIIEFFFENFFFLTTYIFTGRDGIEVFIINMSSTLLIGIILSWLITRIAVEKEYTKKGYKE